MSYGQNLAWGLQATKTLTGAPWNGQVNPYFIDPTPGQTTQSIFRGDPVVMTATGYITSLYQAGAPTTTPILGVFDGCEYITPTSTNPIDPASPGRPYWPAGTITLNNVPATAFVIDDPNVIFNVQTSQAPGLTQGNMGNTAPVAFNVTAGLVNGNTNTGISLVTIDQANLGTAADLNLKIIRLVPYIGNVSGLQYNNAEVIIQNHFFCSRPAGV